MSTIWIKNLSETANLEGYYKNLITKELKALGVNTIRVVTNIEETDPKDTTMLVISSHHILADNLSYQSANNYFNTPFNISAIIIPEQFKNFSYRFTNLQFSPLCFIYNPHRNTIHDLSLYLASKFNIKAEVLK